MTTPAQLKAVKKAIRIMTEDDYELFFSCVKALRVAFKIPLPKTPKD